MKRLFKKQTKLPMQALLEQYERLEESRREFVEKVFLTFKTPLRWVCFINWLFRKAKTRPEIPKNIKKILVCNIASLGDVVTSTVVLPYLKARYPEAQIGFLASSDGAEVIKMHPLVSKVHIYNHGMHNGGYKRKSSYWKWYLGKDWLWFPSKLIRELREERYDVAIELYFLYLNANFCLHRAGIPVRIGYEETRFPNLLTHTIRWDAHDRYIGKSHLNLLRLLNMDVTDASVLPDYNFSSKRENYVVMHLAGSVPDRDWDRDRWVELIRKIQDPVLLTGKGERDGEMARYIAERTKARNLCNQLDFPSFVSVVQNAKLLISVDTVAVHVAAASKTPVVVLWSNNPAVTIWMPPQACVLSLDDSAEFVYERAMAYLGAEEKPTVDYERLLEIGLSRA